MNLKIGDREYPGTRVYFAEEGYNVDPLENRTKIMPSFEEMPVALLDYFGSECLVKWPGIVGIKLIDNVLLWYPLGHIPYPMGAFIREVLYGPGPGFQMDKISEEWAPEYRPPEEHIRQEWRFGRVFPALQRRNLLSQNQPMGGIYPFGKITLPLTDSLLHNIPQEVPIFRNDQTHPKP